MGQLWQGAAALPRSKRLRMIKFDRVTKRYADGTVAVDDLSLEVPTGEITVFVGPSGCGKTTSLRMINRMIDATDGQILLDGVDVKTIDPPTRWRPTRRCC